MLNTGTLASIIGAERKKIEVFSREKKELVPEIVCGEDLLRLSYGTPIGVRLTTKLWARRWLSIFGGMYYDSRLSRRKIKGFVAQLEIDVAECEKELREYRSFNQFFARKLKDDSRPLPTDPGAVLSPGDGRLLVFPRIDEESLSYVKWAPVQLMSLFNQDRALVERYRGGSCCVLRLNPSDYHRFHFPVSGLASLTLAVPGLLHSVSPYALERKIPVFGLNKRTICTLATENFGQLLLMEVGALGVGSIIQTYEAGAPVTAGQEKGYFKFGGSTTILFAEEGKISFDDDLLENSAQGVETIVKMGETIANLASATP